MTGPPPVEADAAYRRARLLLLLRAAGDAHPLGLDEERLGAYDFLAAHALLLARRADDPDRADLLFHGADPRSLGYASPAQRFIAGQLALPADLAYLVAAGLVACVAAGRVRYRLTESGQDVAAAFTSVHAQAYGAAAAMVVARLRRVSGLRLRRRFRDWSAAGPGLLDPADLVDLDRPREATPSV